MAPAVGDVGETLVTSVEGIAGGGVLAGNWGCRDTDNKYTAEKESKREESSLSQQIAQPKHHSRKHNHDENQQRKA